jgi:hypothetical protein
VFNGEDRWVKERLGGSLGFLTLKMETAVFAETL